MDDGDAAQQLAAGRVVGQVQRNYRGALDYIPFWRYAATSVFLVILNIVGTVFSCSLVAYAFARLHWPGRNFCFGLMLATMMIPPPGDDDPLLPDHQTRSAGTTR